MPQPIRWSALLALCAACWASGDAPRRYWIETVAGGAEVGDGGQAVHASFSQAEGVAAAPDGTLYVADAGDHRIRIVSPEGRIATLAGDGVPGFSGDGGPARAARLNQPYGLALDRSGNLFVADFGNSRVRRISRDGQIATVAGGGSIAAGDGDGSAASLIRLRSPRNVALDAAGNLYISDFDAHQVYQVDLNGTFHVVAGTGASGRSGDGGPARDARLSHPAGLAVDAAGTLYIADTGNRCIRRVDGRLIGSLGTAPVVLGSPAGISIDAAGTLWIADPPSRVVWHFSATSPAGYLDLPARDVWAGSAAPAFSTGSQVMRYAAPLPPYLVAGDGSYSARGDGGPATQARLNGPYAVAGGDGGFFIGDMLNRRVRWAETGGLIRTWAAGLEEVAGLAPAPGGSVYAADRAGHRIVRASADGTLTTVAGTGTPGYGGDRGRATAALLNAPHGLALDRAGNLYVADTGNGSVRRISTEGIIETVARDIGEPRGLAIGRRGSAVHCRHRRRAHPAARRGGWLETVASGLKQPRGLSLDSEGRLWIAESGAHRVVALGSDGEVVVMAGSAVEGFAGDGGAALAAQLDSPMDVLALADGSVLVADFGNDRVRRLVPVPELVVQHAATARTGPAAPGEIVSLYGGGLDVNCTVFAGGLPVRILYAGPGQINAVLPGSLVPGERVEVSAECSGKAGGRTTLEMAAAVPGLFTSGTRAAALNEDGVGQLDGHARGARKHRVALRHGSRDGCGGGGEDRRV